MGKEKRTFSKEFREEAVKMVLAGDRSMTEIAKSLGVEIWHLSSWKSEHLKEQGSSGKSTKRTPEQEEIFQLKKRIADLEMDNAILKKATAIFSRQK